MRRLLLAYCICSLFFSSSVYAHVANEKTLYDDIDFSKAKEQIVYLRGLNIIAPEEGAKLYKPKVKLTRAELAFWAAGFKKLGGQDANKAELQRVAVEQGLVSSLEGYATYGDVNQAYFNGQAAVETPGAELSKEQFALFMGRFLNEKVDGGTLFEQAGFEPGPSGIVEQVSFEMEGEGEHAYKVFRFTVEGTEYQVSKHPKIVYGPVDLSEWEGKEIVESWISSGEGGKKVIELVKGKKEQFSENAIVGVSQVQANSMKDTGWDDPQPAEGSALVPIIGGSILAVILGWLLFKKGNKKSP